MLKHPSAPFRHEDEQVRMLAADALASFGDAAGLRAPSVLASLAKIWRPSLMMNALIAFFWLTVRFVQIWV